MVSQFPGPAWTRGGRRSGGEPVLERTKNRGERTATIDIGPVLTIIELFHSPTGLNTSRSRIPPGSLSKIWCSTWGKKPSTRQTAFNHTIEKLGQLVHFVRVTDPAVDDNVRGGETRERPVNIRRSFELFDRIKRQPDSTCNLRHHSSGSGSWMMVTTEIQHGD